MNLLQEVQAQVRDFHLPRIIHPIQFGRMFRNFAMPTVKSDPPIRKRVTVHRQPRKQRQ